MQKSSEFIEKNIDNNSTVVIGCSGGPDSMCLLTLLRAVKQQKNLKIIVAHVDHNMRIESHDELLFVKNNVKDNNDVFESMIINKDVPHSESEFRTIRYNFFKEVVAKYNAKYLLTAHHGDDLIETILMRIVRGSNVNGYTGFKKIINKKNYTVLRPLIYVTKDEILEYNKEHNIFYVLDKSNESDDYTRNRYRHTILPFLKQEEKNVHEKFLKFSEQLLDYENYFNTKIDEFSEKLFVNGKLSIAEFKFLDSVLKRKAIEKMLSIVYEDDLFLISDKNIEEIIKLIGNNNSNGEICLPNGYTGNKVYGFFSIQKKTQNKEFYFELKNELELPNGFIIRNVSDNQSKSNYVIRLNSQEIKLPLYVRNRQNGDYIEIKNLKGKKKVKNIFIDEKISVLDRNSIPIVIDSNNTLIWIPGVKKSKFDKEFDEIYDIILECEKENKYE